MITKIIVLGLCLLGMIQAYPVRCSEIGSASLGSVLGVVTDCDVLSDPLPFRWTSTVKLSKNVKWAGPDDVKYIYSNPDGSI